MKEPSSIRPMNMRANVICTSAFRAALGVVAFLFSVLILRTSIRTPAAPSDAVAREKLAHFSERVPVNASKMFGLSSLVNDEHLNFSFGNADLQMFLGTWEELQHPSETNAEETSEILCPDYAARENKFNCDFSSRSNKTYVAPNLRPYNHQALMEHLNGSLIVLVGDSLTGQMYDELQCFQEYHQSKNDKENFPNPFIWIRAEVTSDLAYGLSEMVHARHFAGEPDGETKYRKVFGHWMDQILRMQVKPKYVVINTGAWWNPFFFRWKLDWCNFDQWPIMSLHELLMLYELTLRQVLLPMMQELNRDYYIRFIWRDLSPARFVTMEETASSKWPYHGLMDKYNAIGREVVGLANGYILPIWYLSYQRRDEHKDDMHWCAYHGTQSVPAVWSTLLYNMIVSEDVEDHSGRRRQLAPSRSLRQVTAQPSDHAADADTRNQERIAFLYTELYRQYLKQKTMAAEHTQDSHNAICSCSEGKTYVHCTANRHCAWQGGRCVGE